jgi:hypothetical protein
MKLKDADKVRFDETQADLNKVRSFNWQLNQGVTFTGIDKKIYIRTPRVVAFNVVHFCYLSDGLMYIKIADLPAP